MKTAVWWAKRPADNRGRPLLGTDGIAGAALGGGGGARGWGVWTGAPQLPSHGSLFPSPPPPPLRLRAHLRCHLSLSLFSVFPSLSSFISLPICGGGCCCSWVGGVVRIRIHPFYLFLGFFVA